MPSRTSAGPRIKWRTTALLTLLVFAGCDRLRDWWSEGQGPVEGRLQAIPGAPDLALAWQVGTQDTALSSPELVDINGDQLVDVVVGFGVQGRGGGVLALDGRNGERLWATAMTDEVYATPLAIRDANGIRVFVGSRGGEFAAFDGLTGAKLWRLDIGVAPPASFASAQVIRHRGKQALLVVQGGDLDHLRPAGRLWIVEPETGAVLDVIEAADGAEIYGYPWIDADRDAIWYGTGGYAQPGGVFVAKMASSGHWQTEARGPKSEAGVLGHILPWPESQMLLASFFDGKAVLFDRLGSLHWADVQPAVWSHSSAIPVRCGQSGTQVCVARVLHPAPFLYGADVSQATLLRQLPGSSQREAIELGAFVVATPIAFGRRHQPDDLLVVVNDGFDPTDYGRFNSELALIDGSTLAVRWRLPLPGVSGATPTFSLDKKTGRVELYVPTARAVQKFRWIGAPIETVSFGSFRRSYHVVD